MRLIACLFALLAGMAAPALAGSAVTYEGRLGKAAIIAEIAYPEDAAKAPAGRYAYRTKAIDIPLDPAKPGGTDEIRFDEEAPCTETLCRGADGDAAEHAPIGAEWVLKPEDGGARLTGTWRDTASGKTLPITLQRRATRAVDTTNYSALESLSPDNSPVQYGDPRVITPEDLPYDFLKMDFPLEKGQEAGIGGAVYRMDRDARIGLDYPVVTAIGDTDVGPLNRFLAQQRLLAEMRSFACGSQVYLGLGWTGMDADGSTGYDGGLTVTVEHLSPRLMGFSESGSFWCGGAYPDNFLTHRLVDARRGEPIMPETLLRGWQAIGGDGAPVDPATYPNDDDSLSYQPSAELVAYVRQHRQKFDPESEEQCGIDELIAGNLGVYLRQDSLVFTLKDLPHAIFACTDDLLEVPLKDARPLLTDAAAGYFEVLDR